MYQLRCWKPLSLPLSHGSFTPDQREHRERRALPMSRMPNPALSYMEISGSPFLLSITESRGLPTVFTFGIIKRSQRESCHNNIYKVVEKKKSPYSMK